MKISKAIKEGNLFLKIHGDLDASSAIEVDSTIDNALSDDHSRILIDCVELDYISSAGLGVFISHLDRIKKNNGTLVFYNMNETVESAFRLLGLDQLIPIVKTEKEAKEMADEN